MTYFSMYVNQTALLDLHVLFLRVHKIYMVNMQFSGLNKIEILISKTSQD